MRGGERTLRGTADRGRLPELAWNLKATTCFPRGGLLTFSGMGMCQRVLSSMTFFQCDSRSGTPPSSPPCSAASSPSPGGGGPSGSLSSTAACSTGETLSLPTARSSRPGSSPCPSAETPVMSTSCPLGMGASGGGVCAAAPSVAACRTWSELVSILSSPTGA